MRNDWRETFNGVSAGGEDFIHKEMEAQEMYILRRVQHLVQEKKVYFFGSAG